MDRQSEQKAKYFTLMSSDDSPNDGCQIFLKRLTHCDDFQNVAMQETHCGFCYIKNNQKSSMPKEKFHFLP